MENLSINKREKAVHHQAKKTRKCGKIPGILYGKEVQNTLIEIGELEFNDYISKQGTNSILDIELDGNNHKALIKEVQRHPLNRNVIHVDLEEVNDNKTIITNVPVSFSGEEMLTKSGVVLQKQKDNVKVKCKACDIPKHIDINVSRARVGNNYKVADVEFASEISVLDSLESVIATVSYEQKR